jgi:hypothetical protein
LYFADIPEMSFKKTLVNFFFKRPGEIFGLIRNQGDTGINGRASDYGGKLSLSDNF